MTPDRKTSGGARPSPRTPPTTAPGAAPPNQFRPETRARYADGRNPRKRTILAAVMVALSMTAMALIGTWRAFAAFFGSAGGRGPMGPQNPAPTYPTNL